MEKLLYIIYNGIIKSTKDKIFKYASNAFHGNYGGIIINPNSNSIIGIHININKKEYKNIYLNNGIYIKYIIDDINNAFLEF